MTSPKDVLVSTTSMFDGIQIKRYLKPLAAHVVTGTNLFVDFLGGLTDVLGGRSESYQKQLSSIYKEVIERIKLAAYEIGANAIVGLNIDIDEISGKGKSMFMVTAVGTGVVIAEEQNASPGLANIDKGIENIGIDRLTALRTKKNFIEQANAGTLKNDEEIWSFITNNQVVEMFPYVVKRMKDSLRVEESTPGVYPYANDKKYFISYLEALPDKERKELIYTLLKEDGDLTLAWEFIEIIKELNLFEFNPIIDLLKHPDFIIRKMGVAAASCDKPFYNKSDISQLEQLISTIKEGFPDRGQITTKKQILSSKEKEVWICECGKTVDMHSYCSGCNRDIKGFTKGEVKPDAAISHLEETVHFLKEFNT